MLEKLFLRKFWKIIRKTSLVAFLLKNSNCPIHPPITTGKLTPWQIFSLFVLRILKLEGQQVYLKSASPWMSSSYKTSKGKNKDFARENKFFAMPMPMPTSMLMLMPRWRCRDFQMALFKWVF